MRWVMRRRSQAGPAYCCRCRQGGGRYGAGTACCRRPRRHSASPSGLDQPSVHSWASRAAGCAPIPAGISGSRRRSFLHWPYDTPQYPASGPRPRPSVGCHAGRQRGHTQPSSVPYSPYRNHPCGLAVLTMRPHEHRGRICISMRRCLRPSVDMRSSATCSPPKRRINLHRDTHGLGMQR